MIQGTGTTLDWSLINVSARECGGIGPLPDDCGHKGPGIFIPVIGGAFTPAALFNADRCGSRPEARSPRW